MGSVRSWLVLAACLSNIPAAFAKGSVQAQQLSIIPLPPSVKCNRMFFKSTEAHKGTVFMMPRVVPSAGPTGRRFYDVARTNHPDKFALLLRLFFPDSDDQVRIKDASLYQEDPDACNLDEVKLAINRHLEQTGEERIVSIARAPLTSIEVSITGFKNIARIGRTIEDSADKEKEVDILDYYGKVRTANFAISGDELAYFNAAITDSEGLSATVKFRFQVRSLESSVTAQLDYDELQKALHAKLKGEAYVVKAQLQAALRSSLNSQTIKINVEAGSEEANKAMQEMVDKVMQQFTAAIEKLPASSGTPDAEGEQGKIAVSAALEVLKNKVKRAFEYKQFGAPETATAETEIRLRSSMIRDYNIIEKDVSADYLDPATGIRLMKDQTIAISPNSWWVDKVTYDEPQTSYLTTQKIAEYKLAQVVEDDGTPVFPELTQSDIIFKNENRNGTDLAVGKQRAFWGFMDWLSKDETGMKRPKEYRFVQIKYIAKRQRIASARFNRPDFEEVKNLPIALTFTGISDRLMVSFKDLFDDNIYWDAKYEQSTGRIMIKAKRDLGEVMFREQMSGNTFSVVNIDGKPQKLADVVKGKKMSLLEAYMMRVGITGSQKFSKRVCVQDDATPILQQKTIRFSIIRPEAFNGDEEGPSALADSPLGSGGEGQPVRAAAPAPARAAPVLPGAPMPEIPEQTPSQP